jgi:peptidoglycan/xylan/chitin deacetylase (PgdA/CDA1 family)
MKRARHLYKTVTDQRDKVTFLPDKTRALIVTHDVDWPRSGPGISHILARRDRFDPDVIRKVVDEGFNPYYGIPTIAEIEERFSIRSTFFFRPKYDDESRIDEYKDVLEDLVKDRWEIGLHLNDPTTVKEITTEKNSIERIVGAPISGSRVHYLRVSEDTFSNLAKAGLRYDSSLMYSKEKIDIRNSGCLLNRGLVVFPITFMDAYMFTNMGVTEKTVVSFVLKAMDKLFASGVQIMTLLWHDNSVMMKGGRAYSNLIGQLVSRSDIIFLKAIEAFELVQKQTNRS